MVKPGASGLRCSDKLGLGALSEESVLPCCKVSINSFVSSVSASVMTLTSSEVSV